MWWQTDDIADKLIANNAARPLPGMEKPGHVDPEFECAGPARHVRWTTGRIRTALPEGDDTDSKSGFPERLAD